MAATVDSPFKFPWLVHSLCEVDRWLWCTIGTRTLQTICNSSRQIVNPWFWDTSVWLREHISMADMTLDWSLWETKQKLHMICKLLFCLVMSVKFCYTGLYFNTLRETVYGPYDHNKLRNKTVLYRRFNMYSKIDIINPRVNTVGGCIDYFL